MGRKVSGFMIKGELPGSACEILQMLGISRSFTNESLEATVFEAEVEYEQIKGRATHYDAVEPNKFDLEKRNSTNYAEISVKRSGGWTIVMARYAFDMVKKNKRQNSPCSLDF